MLRPPPLSPRPATLFPYTTLFRSPDVFGKSVPTAGNHVLKTASMSVTRARYPRRYAFVAAALLASAGGAVIAQPDGDSGTVALADERSGASEAVGIGEICRASGRARVRQKAEISGIAVTVKLT